MYLPSHFAEHRVEVLHEALRGAGLVTLFTAGPEGLDASHLPMLLEPGPGPHGRLVGHVARANPQWRATPAGSAALAVVMGPDAYVTPSWYPSKQATGKVVPTWNYLALHVHGEVRFFEERAPLLELVTRLTDRHEGKRAAPWKVADAPPEYVDGLLKAIVGVELVISRLEGKWKASQNRDDPDRLGVAEGLRQEGDEVMARLVEGKGA
ncbi:MAG: FMN-binding negative transcriptional regulator [Anaeromyxobacter sp.]|nr:FMN-binding negative transcriptional regulator [Anaeromyxobacter sp.]